MLGGGSERRLFLVKGKQIMTDIIERRNCLAAAVLAGEKDHLLPQGTSTGSTRLFRIAMHFEAVLSARDIWPDGGSPVTPTAQDVVDTIEEYGDSLLATLEDWHLDRGAIVRVTSVEHPKDK